LNSTFFLNSSASSSDKSNRNTERRARNIVQANIVEEGDGLGITTVLTADTTLQHGVHHAALLDGDLDELANTTFINRLEGIALVDTEVLVLAEEDSRVITRETTSHLGKIVGTEGEEFSFLSDLVGGDGGAGDFDHGTDGVVELARHVVLGEDGLGGLDGVGLGEGQFGLLADEGDHDFRSRGPGGVHTGDFDGSFHNGTDLHVVDLGVRDTETATAVAEHGVGLVEILDALGDGGGVDTELGGEFALLLLLIGDELVERRVEEADGAGETLHLGEDTNEVIALEGKDLGEGSLATGFVVGENHLTDGVDLVSFEEHVLSTAEADTFSTEVEGGLGVAGGISVGTDTEALELLAPLEDGFEVTLDFSLVEREGTLVDETLGTVKSDVVTFLDGLRTEGAGLAGDGEVRNTSDAGAAHTTSDDSGVRGHTTTSGDETLSGMHTSEIFRGSLKTDHDGLLTLGSPGDGVFG